MPRGATDEHDVAGLQVAVDDAIRVGGVEPADDLLEEVEGQCGLEWPIVANVFAQGMAVEELHAEEPDFGSGRRDIAVELVDAADVGMRNGAGLFYFPAKAFDHGVALREIRTDRLDGHTLPKLRVPGFVDFAHATACNEAMNLNPAGDGASQFERWC